MFEAIGWKRALWFGILAGFLSAITADQITFQLPFGDLNALVNRVIWFFVFVLFYVIVMYLLNRFRNRGKHAE
jgi:predicted membrane channel-forming protein YqfA (hemolysin III family)